jgi:hypothetical protein
MFTTNQTPRHDSVVRFLVVVPKFGRLALLIAALAVPWVGYGFSSGPYGGFTGAPGEDNCRHCHKSFPLNSGGGMITIDGFPDSYTPGETYHVTISMVSQTALDWGFEATVITDQGKKRAGKLIVTDPAHTKIVPGIFLTERRYIEQKTAGHYDGQRGGVSWMFDWRAPKKAKGPITIYACGNAGNDNDKPTGDFIYSVQHTAMPPT